MSPIQRQAPGRLTRIAALVAMMREAQGGRVVLPFVKLRNKPMHLKRVILESPFAGKGDTPEAIEADRKMNVKYARAAMQHALSRGEAPMVSHLLYTQCLNDDNEFERDLGIHAGLAWGEVCEKTVVYVDRGISRGMQLGIDTATTLGRQIETRKVPGWQED